MNSNDRDGTTIRRVSEASGKPTITEERHIPAAGRISNGDRDSRRIEDVSDDAEAEQRAGERGDGGYEETIEDEYAKREGGA